MSYELPASLFATCLLAGSLAALWIGRRIGARRLRDDPEGARVGVGAVEGAVFGLMGLLIAFTFSGAASRFDARRGLIVEEANAIGTAWLRLDLLAPAAQPAIRETFRDYVDARIATYRALGGPASRQALADAQRLAGDLWSEAVAAAPGGVAQAPMLLLPALNEMFDIATTRATALEMHPPRVVFGMLFGLTLLASLLAGFAMAGGRRPSWLHMIGFAAVMGVSAYVILDLEYPRRGLIRVDAFDHVLVEQREHMD